MKKSIILLLLIASSIGAKAQGLTGDMLAYTKDSAFEISSDSISSNYCKIQPITYKYSDPKDCNILEITRIDWDIQGNSASLTYSLRSIDGTVRYVTSVTIDNTITNDLQAYGTFGLKFIYWKISELANLTIE